MLETVIGFALGVLLGLVIAVWLWFCPFANSVAAPYLVVLHALPKIALGPVIIVWAGAGMSAIIVMAVAISLIVTVLELSGGFAATDSALITTIKSFGADRKQIFLKVVFPSSLPVLFQSLKVNIGLSLVGVIAGEFLVSKAGLGYLIVYAGQVFRMDMVMMSVIILGVIAFVMYRLVGIARQIAEKNIKFYTINANAIAMELGLGSHTNTILQAAFFALTDMLPASEAMELMKNAARKKTGE